MCQHTTTDVCLHTEAAVGFFFSSYLWGSGAAEEEEKAAAAPVTRLGMAGQEELTAFVSRKASILRCILLLYTTTYTCPHATAYEELTAVVSRKASINARLI